MRTSVVFAAVDRPVARRSNCWEKAVLLVPDLLCFERGSKDETLRPLPAAWTSPPPRPRCLHRLHCPRHVRCLEPVHGPGPPPFVLGSFWNCVLRGLGSENLCWVPQATWKKKGQDVVVVVVAAAAAAVVAAAAGWRSQQPSERHLYGSKRCRRLPQSTCGSPAHSAAEFALWSTTTSPGRRRRRGALGWPPQSPNKKQKQRQSVTQVTYLLTNSVTVSLTHSLFHSHISMANTIAVSFIHSLSFTHTSAWRVQSQHHSLTHSLTLSFTHTSARWVQCSALPDLSTPRLSFAWGTVKELTNFCPVIYFTVSVEHVVVHNCWVSRTCIYIWEAKALGQQGVHNINGKKVH